MLDAHSVAQDEGKKNALVESCFDWVGAATIALCVVALVFSMFFRVVNVSGDSMTNTLQSGERLLLTSTYSNLKYGDIVVIRREGATPLIKRVIGLPGDTIFINGGEKRVYRNGERLTEPYVRGEDTPQRGLESAYTVPEDGIFVLGDNRSDSLDSRELKDQIKLKDVVGVVTYRLSPFESLRNGE